MQKNGAKLTVFFEEPFWVGLYQRWSGPKLEVAKITFGAEPKDGEVYQFLLEHWKWLSFSPPVEQEIPEERRVNPKRARRESSERSFPPGRGRNPSRPWPCSGRQPKRPAKRTPASARSGNGRRNSKYASESERKSTAADKEAPPLFQGFLEGKAGLFAM